MPSIFLNKRLTKLFQIIIITNYYY